MNATVSLKATSRAGTGKGAARAERRAGRIPAVIYGEKQPAMPISVERREIEKQIAGGNFMTTIYEIDVEGKVTRVLPRDLQTDPVKDIPLHIDFLRVARGARIEVLVPVTFINEDQAPGIRRGGVLNVVRHEIEVSCAADAIPDEIIADLTGLALGDTLHISAISLPEGVTPTITDRDFTVATIAAPAGLQLEQEDAAAAEAAVEEAFEAAGGATEEGGED